MNNKNNNSRNNFYSVVPDLRYMSVDDISELYKKMYHAGFQATPYLFADLFKKLVKIFGILLIVGVSCLLSGAILERLALLFS